MKLLKWSIVIVIAVLCGIGGWFVYQVNQTPTAFEVEQARGPAVYAALLADYDNLQSDNNDVFSSSTYRPSDPLYQPVLKIQFGRYDEANQLLAPMVEKHNAEAEFWLGYSLASQSGSEDRTKKVFNHKNSLEWFEESAKHGNVYAAMHLSPGSEECQDDKQNICNKAWQQQAHSWLTQNAAKGDVKAQYFLFDIDKATTVDDHRKLVSIITANARNHYYKPLLKAVDDIKHRRYYPNYLKDKDSNNEEYDLCSKLRLLAVYNNDVTAMTAFKFGIGITSQQFSRIFTKSYALSVLPANIYWHLMIYTGGDQHQYYVKSVVGLAYATAMDRLFAEPQYVSEFNSLLKRSEAPTMTPDQVKQAQALSQQIEKDLTPVIYLDPMTPYGAYDSIL